MHALHEAQNAGSVGFSSSVASDRQQPQWQRRVRDENPMLKLASTRFANLGLKSQCLSRKRRFSELESSSPGPDVEGPGKRCEICWIAFVPAEMSGTARGFNFAGQNLRTLATDGQQTFEAFAMLGQALRRSLRERAGRFGHRGSEG